MATKKQSKGSVGNNTGATTRKAVRSKIKQGASVKKIASSTNRSPSTIRKIASGVVKNPPKGLAASVRKVKAKGSQKSKIPKRSSRSKSHK